MNHSMNHSSNVCGKDLFIVVARFVMFTGKMSDEHLSLDDEPSPKRMKKCTTSPKDKAIESLEDSLIVQQFLSCITEVNFVYYFFA